MSKVKEAVKAAVSAGAFAVVVISAYVAATASELREDVLAFIGSASLAAGAAFSALKNAWKDRAKP